MREGCGKDFGFGARNDAVLLRCLAVLAFKSRTSRSPATRLLRTEQSSSDDVQVGERSGHFQAVQVLRQPPIAGLAEAEDVLDHAEHVLDLGADPRLVAVLRLYELVDAAVEAVAAVREVLGVRSARVDDLRLALIALVAPDARLFAMQQV